MGDAEQSRKSRKAAAAEADPVIPDKLYFRIGEAARLLAIAPYTLRFWETEFPQLRPGKGGTGQRLYRKREVELALRIKHLLYREGYTIPGARQLLKAEARERGEQMPLVEAAAPESEAQQLRKVRAELKEISTLLAAPVAPVRTGNSSRAAIASRRGLHLAVKQPAVSAEKVVSLFREEITKPDEIT